MKRMAVSEYVRVQGIGQSAICLKDMMDGFDKLEKRKDGEGFRTVFEEELKRQEEKDGELKEADIGSKETDAEARAKLEELACTAWCRGQYQPRSGQQGIREAAGTDKGVMGC